MDNKEMLKVGFEKQNYLIFYFVFDCKKYLIKSFFFSFMEKSNKLAINYALRAKNTNTPTSGIDTLNFDSSIFFESFHQ